jgi:hypothetical protein
MKIIWVDLRPCAGCSDHRLFRLYCYFEDGLLDVV